MNAQIIDKMRIVAFLDSGDFVVNSQLLKNSQEVIRVQPTYFFGNQQKKWNVGERLHLKATGKYFCTECSAAVKKLNSGFCYKCLLKRPAADLCVLNPVKCHFFNGTCRDESWALAYCFEPHVVYLSFTDKVKVGITRLSNLPTRWVDQGATLGTALALVPSRRAAGILENEIAQIIPDKSHWKRMLEMKWEDGQVDLILKTKQEVNRVLSSRISELVGLMDWPKGHSSPKEIQWFSESPVLRILYEQNWNAKVPSTSIDLLKRPELEIVPLGFKGQYVVTEQYCFNVRKHGGFEVEISS